VRLGWVLAQFVSEVRISTMTGIAASCEDREKSHRLKERSTCLSSQLATWFVVSEKLTRRWRWCSPGVSRDDNLLRAAEAAGQLI
jgi:hypothetical protein